MVYAALFGIGSLCFGHLLKGFGLLLLAAFCAAAISPLLKSQPAPRVA